MHWSRPESVTEPRLDGSRLDLCLDLDITASNPVELSYTLSARRWLHQDYSWKPLQRDTRQATIGVEFWV